MDTTLRAAAFLDKGSVGKTTTIAHVGVALPDEGHRVCLLDLTGKQGDLTKHFSLWQQVLESDEWPNITTVFHSLYANRWCCRRSRIYWWPYH
jgi:chromosome partitioning protein